MSLARGPYGIEYNPRPTDGGSDGAPVRLALVALVVVAGLVSITWSLVARHRQNSEEQALVRQDSALAPDEPRRVRPDAETAAEPAGDRATGGVFQAAAPLKPSGLMRRPPEVRNLLLRLEEAERTRDTEMAVSTIEQIRGLPGSPAADLDDALARRLGTLNVRRLFVGHNPQWVKKVIVRRGDLASRLAYENGSTLESFARLNGGRTDEMTVGETLYVLNHPRFNLLVRRRAQMADLQLNGKFFKRYDLQSSVTGSEGQYEFESPARKFWRALGIEFTSADRAEIETLLPHGAPVQISEM